MKIEIHKCDVCKKEILQYKEDNNKKVIPVIFHTEQTEGRSCKPYLEFNKIDICNDCYNNIIINSTIINANGAQGYNDYFFKKLN